MGSTSVVYTPELRDYHGTCSEDRLELRLDEDEKRGLIRDQDDHDLAKPRERAATPGKNCFKGTDLNTTTSTIIKKRPVFR